MILLNDFSVPQRCIHLTHVHFIVSFLFRVIYVSLRKIKKNNLAYCKNKYDHSINAALLIKLITGLVKNAGRYFPFGDKYSLFSLLIECQER